MGSFQDLTLKVLAVASRRSLECLSAQFVFMGRFERVFLIFVPLLQQSC